MDIPILWTIYFMLYKNYLSKNLVYLREAANLTQSDIQDRMGITRNTWSNWENEKSEPGLENLFKIAQFFKIDVGKLLAEDLTLSHSITITGAEEPQQVPLQEEVVRYKPSCNECVLREEMIDLQQQTIKALEGQIILLKTAMQTPAKK